MDFSKLSFSDAPLIKITPPGPRSQEFLDYQSEHEGAAVSYPRGMPMAVSRAKGATVEDVDGNIYIDFFGGAGVMNVGHANPDVIDAAAEQLFDLTHSLDFPNPARRAMVETLLNLLPEPLNRVQFGGPTGSDAVEAAMKLAKFNTGRIPMISFEGAYHGMTAGALSLTSNLGFKEEFLPLVPEVHFVPYAYCYRCAFNKEPATCELDCAQYLEHVIEDPHSGVGRPAAIIVEAIQGEGGTIVPPDLFIPKIRDICNKYEIIMIVDEVQAGFCRTGKMFAFEHSGIVPDIVAMSKALGGAGFPISCIAYREEADIWPPGKHIGTFRGNVIAYAAGNAGLQFMVKNNLALYSLQVGGLILSMLKELEKNSKIVGQVRGKGLMIGVEFVKDKSMKEPAPDFAKKVRTICHQNGLLIEIGGHYDNVARFLPPLVLTEELAKKGTDIFASAVEEVEEAL
jgi:diaminobutyrate-2-oxoglutarate transaminase